ncbi:MAG: hypothetical protein GY913_13190 [Proteobacteria bacterium]|nr:hypothetical protein [Pseudomonadota bacterium]MCP4917861.1 hypothetical protein [Pseudomonadota bacterium]
MSDKKPLQHLWQKADALDEKDVNYLQEMVTSQVSVLGLVGALGLGAVLSVPLGLGIGAIPIIAALAAEGVLALFLPSSPVFREFVNKRKRMDQREAVRTHLLEELASKARPDDKNWRTYERMRERLSSLKSLAGNRDTSLSGRNVEDLDSATVDFLGLWVAWLAMRERWEDVDERGINRRLGEIKANLGQTDDAVDRHHLEKAASDLERILARRKSLWGRAASVEAGMLSMADTFEEVYQRVVANPNSADAAAALDEAVERMHVEEQLDFAVDAELEGLLKKRRAGQRAKA